jgi:hypothetical protein
MQRSSNIHHPSILSSSSLNIIHIMQFNTLPALALLAVGHFSLQVAADSGYASSCNSQRLLAPTSNSPFWAIVANCKLPSGIFNVDTEININSCFDNNNGVLQAAEK